MGNDDFRDDYRHDPGDEPAKEKTMLIPKVKINVGKTIVAMAPNSRLSKWIQRKGWGK